MSTPLKEVNTDAVIMFEEVVNKSFEIIKTMLPRLNSLYQLNEELERSVSNVERKLTRLEHDNEELHYELRTNKLAVETKIASLATQFTTICNEPSSKKNLDRNKARQPTEKKDDDCDSPDIRMAKQKDRTRKIIFQDEVKRASDEGKQEAGGMRKRSRQKRESIEVEEEGLPSRVHFSLHSNASIELSEKNIGFHSEKTQFISEFSISRKSNLKSKKDHQVANFKSSKSIRQKGDDKDNEQFANFLREVEKYHFHNQQMKQNYEKLMDQYCRQNKEQISVLQQKMDQISNKLQTMDPDDNLLELIQSSSHIELTKNLEQFKSKLNAKLDASTFEAAFKDFNNRLASTHENIRKLANKEETKRAIQYLENKLNFACGQHQPSPKPKNQPQSVHTMEVDFKGCIKSVCSSQDQDLSEHRSRQRQGQTLDMTPKTIRNDCKVKGKRMVTSLHTNILNGPPTQSRFNEARLSLILEKPDRLQDATVRVIRESLAHEREVKLLKQKSAVVLETSKAKPRPRLKKERLIFQYD